MSMSDKELAAEVAALRKLSGLTARDMVNASNFAKRHSASRADLSKQRPTQRLDHHEQRLVHPAPRLNPSSRNSEPRANLARLSATHREILTESVSRMHNVVLGAKEKTQQLRDRQQIHPQDTATTAKAANAQKLRAEQATNALGATQKLRAQHRADDLDYTTQKLRRQQEVDDLEHSAQKLHVQKKADELAHTNRLLAKHNADDPTIEFMTNSLKQLQDQMSVLTEERGSKNSIPSPADLMSNQASLLQNINGMIAGKIDTLASNKQGKGILDSVDGLTETIDKIVKFWSKLSSEEKVYASVGTTALIIGTGILIATLINPALGIGMLLIAGACLALGNKLCKQSLKNHAADPDATAIGKSIDKHATSTKELTSKAERTYKEHTSPRFLDPAPSKSSSPSKKVAKLPEPSSKSKDHKPTFKPRRNDD